MGAVVVLELEETVEQVGDVAVDSSNRIVFTSARAYNPVVGRLTSDGRLDPAFAGGWVRLEPATGNVVRSGYPLALPPDGGVVVLGSDGFHAAVVRLKPDGHLDPAFGNGGVAIFDDDEPRWPDVGAATPRPAPIAMRRTAPHRPPPRPARRAGRAARRPLRPAPRRPPGQSSSFWRSLIRVSS